MLNALGQLWLNGIPVNWSAFSAQERRCRVPLPTYPFERQRYWIAPKRTGTMRTEALPSPDESPPTQTRDMADWFYMPVWNSSVLPMPQPTHGPRDACWLIFLDTYGLGNHLAQRLTQDGQDVVTVRIGPTIAQNSDDAYMMNPQHGDHYNTLLNQLRLRGKTPRHIVHLWQISVNRHHDIDLKTLEKIQDEGFYSLLYLAQALGKQQITDPLQLDVVSNGMQTLGDQETPSPWKATVLGPCKIIPKEYPNITCRQIDLELTETQIDRESTLVDQLLTELTTQPSDMTVAYRGNDRLVPTLEPVHLEDFATTPPRLREHGVYLITGGLGGIGLTLAGYLAKRVRAKLILVGRSPFPSRSLWNHWLTNHDERDIVSHKIRNLKELEALGAEVLVVRADVADQQEMQEALVVAEARFGPIQGVLHAAGLPDGAVIQNRTRELSEAVLAPKVRGTLVLDRLLRSHRLDFFILCSSLASILAPFGQVAYCAANAFLDAFAHDKTSRDGTFTVSINWPAWQEVGMAINAFKPFAGHSHRPILSTREVTHPLFQQCIIESPTREIFVSHFTSDDWVFHEHRINGQAILPGTVYLEMARAAFEHHAENQSIEIQDVYFLNPLVLGNHEAKEVRTILTKQEEDFEFVVLSQPNPGEDEWQPHSKGKITSIEPELPIKHNIQNIKNLCGEQIYNSSGEND